MQENKLSIKNISYSVTDKDLEELFSNYGRVKKIDLIVGKDCGYIEMSNSFEAKKAKESLDGFYFKGSPLKIELVY